MPENELESPALLVYWPRTEAVARPGVWRSQQYFPTLRDALRAAVSDVPQDQAPWILTENRILKGIEIKALSNVVSPTAE
jgi:hypothetical protein